MNKRYWIEQSTLTKNQRQFKSEQWNEYNSTRRKLNVVGGVLSAVVTLIICTKIFHVDYTQALTDTDKITVASVFLACMFVWRLMRQGYQQSRPVQTLPFGEEERKVIDRMTPKQCTEYICNDIKYEKQCKTDKNKGNATALVLIALVVAAYAYAVNKGVL